MLLFIETGEKSFDRIQRPQVKQQHVFTDLTHENDREGQLGAGGG